LSILLILLSRTARFPPSPEDWTAAAWDEQLAGVIGLLGAPLLGALIATHQPNNRYGWVWCAIGVASAVSAVTAAYAVYALLVAPDGLPGGLGAAWLSTSTSYLTYGLLPFMLLLFPDGHLPSPRWRPVGWAAGLAAAGLVLEAALKAGPLENFPFWDSPFGVALPQKVPYALDNISWLIFYSSLVIVGPAALITRFVRARGQQRQQLKWIAVAGGLVLADPIVTGIFQDQRPVVVAMVDALVFWGIYAAIGIAVLRYRLYDIDRLINRTLVYGLLTAVLGLGYAGVVLLLGQLFGGNVTSNPPSWVVAGATLAVAAVFQPARRRIQQLVDRRFNRRRYNAAKTIEAFSVRLRDHLDLDTLGGELLAVIDQTMEPTAVSLWLHPGVVRSASAGRREPEPARRNQAGS
jgi:hypothetical protein